MDKERQRITDILDGAPATEDNIMTVKFVEKLAREGRSADEVEKAYLLFMGALPEGETNETISGIMKDIQSMADQGFPLNRFVEIIQSKREIENSEQTLPVLIDRLRISDKEKQILYSVFEKRRSGVIGCFVGTDLVAEIKIDATNKNSQQVADEVAHGITRFLSKVSAEADYQFTFSEE